MRRTYTLKNGEKLYTFCSKYGGVTVYDKEVGGNEVAVLEKHKREDGTIYFKYNGEIIEYDSFDHMTFDELLSKVEQGIKNGNRWEVYEDEALATIMRETDRVGFVMEVNCFDVVVPQFGFGVRSDRNKIKALMIPFEERWKKDDWHYKIELCAENEATREATGYETMYFSDLWSGVMSGKWIKLVDRAKYREENPVDLAVKKGA